MALGGIRAALRRLRIGVLLLAAAGLAALWLLAGLYTLSPGEAAVVLRLGSYQRTELREGLHFHLPPPLERRKVVNVGVSHREEFGDIDAEPKSALAAETAMQTSDNNIVLVEFFVQYRIGDPFHARYRVADAVALLRDGAQAAMREVVGRNTIDGVLSEQRGAVAEQAARRLQQILRGYNAGLSVTSVELQEVQPPDPVREAFDDVIAANQDSIRMENEAEGYANEVLPGARAEAAELRAAASAYRDAITVEARGEAQRFLALAAEYRRAPAVTRKRLYLETMEAVLPAAEKVIIEPGTAALLPHLQIGPPGAAQGGAQ